MSEQIFDRKEVYVGRDFGGVTYDITPESHRDLYRRHRRRQSVVSRTVAARRPASRPR